MTKAFVLQLGESGATDWKHFSRKLDYTRLMKHGWVHFGVAEIKGSIFRALDSLKFISMENTLFDLDLVAFESTVVFDGQCVTLEVSEFRTLSLVVLSSHFEKTLCSLNSSC